MKGACSLCAERFFFCAQVRRRKRKEATEKVGDEWMTTGEDHVYAVSVCGVGNGGDRVVSQCF